MERVRRGLAHVKRGSAVQRGVEWARYAVPERFPGRAGAHAVRRRLDTRRRDEAPLYDVHAFQDQALDAVLDALGDVPVLLNTRVARYPRHVMVRTEDRSRIEHALGRLRPTWSVHRTGPTVALRPRLAVSGSPVPADDTPEIYVDVMEQDGGSYRSASLGGLTRIGVDEWEGLAARQWEHRHDHLAPSPQLPVDLVYTWVDGRDPAWARRRDRALGDLRAAGERGLHPTGIDPARFVGTDELRYSLRSVHQYANWVRRIHLVTDGQVPDWLDRTHPRISVVDHHEILGGSRFNSHAIESGLHRIPGLSDHYLYLNDDVFFGRVAHPEDFFVAAGTAKFFPSDLPIDPGAASCEDLPIMAAAKNGRDLVRRRFGLEVGTRIRHTVHPQLREVLEQIDREHPEAVGQVRDSLFRSPSDLSLAASLHHWYAFAQGRAVPATPNYLYVNIDEEGAGQAMDALAAQRRFDTFCLNQERTGSDEDRGRRLLARFLPRYFPVPAPWETDASPAS